MIRGDTVQIIINGEKLDNAFVYKEAVLQQVQHKREFGRVEMIHVVTVIKCKDYNRKTITSMGYCYYTPESLYETRCVLIEKFRRWRQATQ